MPRKPGITDDYIISMYKSEVPYKEMTIKTGLSSRAIHKILCKHNVKMNREQYAGQPRKNKVNEDFFKTWSDEMAWVLGMIVTDGNVYKNTITISQKDERILKRIAQCMNAEYIISPSSPSKSVTILIVNSKEMKQDLSVLGVHPKKSMTVAFPDIPEKYLPAFIRGVVDGDGWVDREGYSMNITTGSNHFAIGLVSVFESWELKPKLISNKSNNESIIYKVKVTQKKNLKRLAEIIYKDSKDMVVYHKRDFMAGSNLHLYNNWEPKRVKFRTNISKNVLENIKSMAYELNTFPNYLIENGLINLLSMENISYIKCKRNRPNDRIQYKTTYDNELLNRVKVHAKMNKVFINDLIEYSINYININEIRREKSKE